MGASTLDFTNIGEELSEDADVTGAYGGAALLLDGSEDGCSGHILSLSLMLWYPKALLEEHLLWGTEFELAVRLHDLHGLLVIHPIGFVLVYQRDSLRIELVVIDRL